LRPGVCDVEIVQRDVLDYFAALVDVALWEGDVGFGFEVVFGGVGVGAADSLKRANDEGAKRVRSGASDD
jgi:hypothetical protein